MPAHNSAAPVEGVRSLADVQISRRTLAKGAAWTVPVIAAVVAAPAAVASAGTASVVAGCANNAATFTAAPTGGPTLPAGTYTLLVGTNLSTPALPGNVVITQTPANPTGYTASVSGRSIVITVTSTTLTSLKVAYSGITSSGNGGRSVSLQTPSGSSAPVTYPNGNAKQCGG